MFSRLRYVAALSPLPAKARPQYEGKETLTVGEVCELLGFSYNTVRELFDSEPGVIVLMRPEKMHKRKYTTVRIPRHVYERVLRRLLGG